MGLPAHAPPTQVPTTSPATGFKMLRLNALLLLSTFFTVGLSVKCWRTGNSAMNSPLANPLATSLRSSAVFSIAINILCYCSFDFFENKSSLSFDGPSRFRLLKWNVPEAQQTHA